MMMNPNILNKNPLMFFDRAVNAQRSQLLTVCLLYTSAPAKLRERQGFHAGTLRQRKALRAEVQGPCRLRLHQRRP